MQWFVMLRLVALEHGPSYLEFAWESEILHFSGTSIFNSYPSGQINGWESDVVTFLCNLMAWNGCNSLPIFGLNGIGDPWHFPNTVAVSQISFSGQHFLQIVFLGSQILADFLSLKKEFSIYLPSLSPLAFIYSCFKKKSAYGSIQKSSGG